MSAEGSECKTDSSSLIGIKSSKKLRRDPFHSPDEGQSPLTLSPQVGSPYGLDGSLGQQRVLSSGSPNQYPTNVVENEALVRKVSKCRDSETLPAEGMTETQKAFDRLRVKNVHAVNGDSNRRAAVIQEEGLSPHSPKKRKARASVQDEPCTLTFGDFQDNSECFSLELASNVGDDHAESPAEQCQQRDQAGITRKHGRNENEQSTLKDLLVQFGHIELNKDFYESIKRTESRTDLPDPSNDVREVDRQAFNSAVSRVKHILQDELPHMQEAPPNIGVNISFSELEEQRAFWDVRTLENVAAIAHCIMQHLVETATPSSSGVTLEISDLTAGSLSRAKSSARNSVHVSKQHEADHTSKEKENNNYQVSIEPKQSDKANEESVINHQIQPGKHPRETHNNSGFRKNGTDESPQMSGVGSLISNEPPKRQRKHICARGTNEDEASSKVIKTAGTLDTVEQSLALPNMLQAKSSSLEDKGKRSDEWGISNHSRPINSIGFACGTHSVDSTSSSKGKQEKQEWDEASNASASLKSAKKKLVNNVGMQSEQEQRSMSHADAPPRWGSSLVCADLSLNDVGSKLYWPLLSSLKTKLELQCREGIRVENNNLMVGAVRYIHHNESMAVLFAMDEPFMFILPQESLTDEIQNHAKDVAEKIRHEVDAVYEEFGSVRKVAGINIALVAAAFEALFYEFLPEIDHEDTWSQ